MDGAWVYCRVHHHLGAGGLEGCSDMVKEYPLALAQYFAGAGYIDAQIMRLSIHRPVADMRSRYVGPEIDAEIAAVELELRRLRERRTA